MKNSQKDGYIAGAGLVFIGIVILITAFDQGILSGGRITGIFGVFLTLIGVGSFLNPNIAETVVHWLKKQQDNDKVSQRQKNAVNSHQISSKGNVTIHQNIYGKK